MSRALVGSCPGCGAQITLRAADSVLAVCEYCSTTCVRDGDGLSKVGVMGALFDDHSPLTLGAVGRADGKSFQLVGRLQNQVADGVWSEWRVLFDDGGVAWLSEDNGSYSIADPRGTVHAPSFDAIEPGWELTFEGTVYRVTYKEQATVISGAGELPFIVGSGYPAPVCDLRGPNGEIATLDYSDLVDANGVLASGQTTADPLLYLGRAVQLAELDLQGVAVERTRTVQLQAFSCPNCGATVTPRLDDTQSLTCASCASLLDVSQGLGEQIRVAAQSKPPEILLPLGSEGTFGKVRWTVVGYMQREGFDGEETFGWEEYLLHNEQEGFRFLNLDSGHWSVGRIAQQSFDVSADRHGRGYVSHDGKRFDQYAEYTASVSYVMGEFFWRVNKGDKTRITDFIHPPRSLCRERSTQEIVWTEGEYVSGEQIARAFNLSANTVPRATGTGMLAELPPRQNRRYLVMGAIALACLVLVQALFMAMGSNAELVPPTRVELGGPAAKHEIVLDGSRPANIEVAITSSILQASFGFSAELSASSPAYNQLLSTEVSYYEGWEGGERWTEGSRKSRLVFTGLEPGRYTLTVSTERFKSTGSFTRASYSVLKQGRPLWLPFLIGLALVVVMAVYGWFSEPDPQVRRWRDSQYGSKPGRRIIYHSDDDD